MKIFIKVVAVTHSKWKVFQKQTFRLTSTIYLLLQCSTEKRTQLYKCWNNSPYYPNFFLKFLFFRFSFFIFFVFCISSNNRSSHRRSSVKEGVLRNFAKVTGKHMCQSLWHWCFPMDFAKFLRTPFLQNTPDDCFCNKLKSITWGICLSFKSRYLELFCEIIIHLLFGGIFLRLWSRGPPCNFTEQLFFLHGCEWLLPIN